MPCLNIENKTDLICLGFLIHDVVAVINLSLETMKNHKLLKCVGLGLSWKEGRPDTIDKPPMSDVGVEQNLSGFEDWLDESIKFRDKIIQVMSSQEEKKTEQ